MIVNQDEENYIDVNAENADRLLSECGLKLEHYATQLVKSWSFKFTNLVEGKSESL